MISGKILKKAAAVTVAAMMAVMSAVPAFAADNVSAYAAGSYTYTAPEKPMKVNDNIITATAHRAAAPILGMMGVNAVSGFGMISGSAPTDLQTAQASAALGIWGSSINSSPDPYYWNYFYNFYAKANNLDESPDALMNPKGVSASPMQADTTAANDPAVDDIDEGYKISVSLSKRPDIAVGVDKNQKGEGYEEQIKIINGLKPESKYYQKGDETYDPELVKYSATTIKNMIESVHSLADAIEAVEKKTGKTTRYGDVQKIANDYEDYVYGMISYIREEIAANKVKKKTVAIVTSIDGDKYEIADHTTQSVTSKMRAFEYSMAVADNLYDKYKKTTLTKDELLTADAILTFDNGGVTRDQLISSLGGSDHGKIIITNTPGSLYGMTMNSVENALGYAFTIGSIYNEVLNPVEAYAYFYEYLCHVTDRSGLETVVRNNFQTVDLPEGIERTLPADYSQSKIKTMLATGKSYYKTYPDEFTDDASAVIGLDAWNTDSKNSTVGSGGKISGFYSVNIADAEGGSASANITNSVADNKITITLTAKTGYAASGVTVKTASGKDVAVTKNSDGTYTFTMPSEEVTVTPAFAKAEIAASVPYTDIVSGAWYYDAVKYVYEKNVMTGTSATTFDPDGKLTRAMLAQILYNNAGKPSASASTMKDVSAGSWFAPAVAWAAEKGVVTGYSDNSFKPNDSVTREQLAVMLYRYAGSPAVTGSLASFNDASSVSPYAQDAVKWAVANGIITGNGNASTLDPRGTASRAQVAVMISRYLEKQQAQ